MRYFVEIYNVEEKRTERLIDCGTGERSAEVTYAGVMRNLNHERFAAFIVEKEEGCGQDQAVE